MRMWRLETESVLHHITTHMGHMELSSKLQNKRLEQRARVVYERCALLRIQVNCFMRIVCGLYEIMSCREQSRDKCQIQDRQITSQCLPGSTCVLILVSACNWCLLPIGI